MPETRPLPNAYVQRDPDHEEHLLLEDANRQALADARVGHVADDHGVDLIAYAGKWRIVPGTDLEVLITETGAADGETYVRMSYRLRRDV